MIFFKLKNNSMIETLRLKSVVIFIQTFNNEFNVLDHIRISKYINIFSKGYVPNCSAEVMFY